MGRLWRILYAVAFYAGGNLVLVNLAAQELSAALRENLEEMLSLIWTVILDSVFPT